MRGRLDGDHALGHYELERRSRVVPFEEQQRSPQSAQYPGSDVFLQLCIERGEARLARNEQVRVEALCTNRDLPMLLDHGKGADFTMPNAGPLKSISCLAGPTPPRGYEHDGETTWCLINHLSQNYLALANGGEALRELLGLYSKLGTSQLQREIAGIRSVVSAPIVGPVPGPGPRQFARGLEINVNCEERAFAAHRFFLLAAVLSEFFGRHASVHSFTETVLHTPERGEVYRWPAVAGIQPAV